MSRAFVSEADSWFHCRTYGDSCAYADDAGRCAVPGCVMHEPQVDDQQRVDVTVTLVRQLIDEQLPQWRNLPVYPIEGAGNDNRTFHLGDGLVVRLPSATAYASQPEREFTWLPVLAGHLPLPIPRPIALGQPSSIYPFHFVVSTYLPGEPATPHNVDDKVAFARTLGRFLGELQSCDAADGPSAGVDNFFRGGPLLMYDDEARRALAGLPGNLAVDKLISLWQQGESQQWEGPGVWLHGDVAPGNLLVQDGRLCGVIDFGLMAVGDPAADYAIAWTFLDAPSRAAFFEAVGADAQAISRGRAWALWKAAITFRSDDPAQARNARYVIYEVLTDLRASARSAG